MDLPTVLFDMDNTLYSPLSGVIPEINRRVTLFVAGFFGVSEEEARVIRQGKSMGYGTTLEWLRDCHNMNEIQEYIDAIHPEDMESWLSPNPHLRSFIQSMPTDYVLFTNSPREHAERTLKALNLDDLFPRIWDFRRLGYIGKPSPLAYERILGDLGKRPEEALLVDDSPANLEAFLRIGGRIVSAVDREPREWAEVLAAELGMKAAE